MLNPNEIDPRHLPSIQAAILKNRSVLDEHLVSKLYRMAKTLLAGGKPMVDSKTMVSVGTGSVSITDADTGLFVQLSGDPNVPNLMFGKKYCQDWRDDMRGNTSTKIW